MLRSGSESQSLLAVRPVIVALQLFRLVDSVASSVMVDFLDLANLKLRYVSNLPGGMNTTPSLNTRYRRLVTVPFRWPFVLKSTSKMLNGIGE